VDIGGIPSRFLFLVGFSPDGMTYHALNIDPASGATSKTAHCASQRGTATDGRDVEQSPERSRHAAARSPPDPRGTD
jgi:hypothetical protein